MLYKELFFFLIRQLLFDLNSHLFFRTFLLDVCSSVFCLSFVNLPTSGGSRGWVGKGIFARQFAPSMSNAIMKGQCAVQCGQNWWSMTSWASCPLKMSCIWPFPVKIWCSKPLLLPTISSIVINQTDVITYSWVLQPYGRNSYLFTNQLCPSDCQPLTFTVVYFMSGLKFMHRKNVQFNV